MPRARTSTRSSDGAGFEKRWRTEFDTAQVQTSNYEAAVVGDSLVVANAAGVTALSRTDGSRRWQWVGATSFDGLVADDEAVHVLTDSGTLVALDTASGSVRWRRTPPTDGDGYPNRTVAATPRYVAAVQTSTTVTVYERSSGTETTQVENVRVADLAAWNGRLLVSAFGLAAYDPGTGERRWRLDLGQSLRTITVEGPLLVGASSSSLTAVDLDARERQWSVRPGARFTPAPASVGDEHVFVQARGPVRALDHRTGETAWRVETDARMPFRPPVVLDSAVVAETGDRVVAVDPGTGDIVDALQAGVRTPSVTATGDGRTLFACGVDVAAYRL